jgi:AraC-like DNA-binding protein
MATPQAPAPAITARPLAQGDGWFVQDVTCRCGPADRPFEERHAWTAVAAALSGVFSYRSACGGAVLVPGALMLGTAGQCYQCGHEHGNGDRCVSFHYAPAFMEAVAGGLRRGSRTAFHRPHLAPADRLLPLLADVRSLASAPDPLRAEQVALSVATAALALDHDTTVAAAAAGDEARAARAVRIIEAHLADPLTIAGLATSVGMTRRRFATAFRLVIGMTPYRYILTRRLDAAADRLRRGPGNVLEIALDAGFGDLSEFTRRFHARYGAPPGTYRLLHRGRR